MPTPGMGKYMRLHQQQEHSSPYSGITTLHSPYSPYAQQSSVSASPHHTPYGSPHDASFAQPVYPPTTHTRPPSWEHAQYSTVDSRHSQQSRSSPTPPSHLSYAPPQEAQLYYPPPRGLSYQTPSATPGGHAGYEPVQHAEITSPPQAPVSTMPTPTQFYARLAPTSSEVGHGNMQPPPDDGVFGGSLELRDGPNMGGSSRLIIHRCTKVQVHRRRFGICDPRIVFGLRKVSDTQRFHERRCNIE